METKSPAPVANGGGLSHHAVTRALRTTGSSSKSNKKHVTDKSRDVTGHHKVTRSRRSRMRSRGSQTCSSEDESDVSDLHSDDNLRPYEEVKVALHDKQLAGLGEFNQIFFRLFFFFKLFFCKQYY